MATKKQIQTIFQSIKENFVNYLPTDFRSNFVIPFILGIFGKMPSFDDLENPDSNVATEIISSDGGLIGKFLQENRTPVKYEELPQHLVKALVATEDERFTNTQELMPKELYVVVRLGRWRSKYVNPTVG